MIGVEFGDVDVESLLVLLRDEFLFLGAGSLQFFSLIIKGLLEFLMVD